MPSTEIIEAIERVQKMRDDAERDQLAMVVTDELTQNIRNETPGHTDYMQSRYQAEAQVAEMSIEQLRETFAAVEDDYWETAESDDHEAYDTASGEIAAFERVLDVLQALAHGLTPAQG